MGLCDAESDCEGDILMDWDGVWVGVCDLVWLGVRDRDCEAGVVGVRERDCDCEAVMD